MANISSPCWIPDRITEQTNKHAVVPDLTETTAFLYEAQRKSAEISEKHLYFSAEYVIIRDNIAQRNNMQLCIHLSYFPQNSFGNKGVIV